MKDPLVELSHYDVRFEGAGVDDRSAFPLGNGEVGVKAWVERNTGIVLELGRSDAISEAERLLKLGRVRVTTEPNVFTGASVVQCLHLADGTLRVDVTSGDEHSAGETRFEIVVDRGSDRVLVRVSSSLELQVSLRPFIWRTAPRPIVRNSPFWGGYDPQLLPEIAELTESADRQLETDTRILIWHRNDSTIVPALAQLHDLGDRLDVIPDEIVDRQFGMLLGGVGAATAEGALHAPQGVHARLWIDTFSSQTSTAEDVLALDVHTDAQRFDEAMQATAEQWREYWQRSWIFVTGDPVGHEAQLAPEVREFPALIDIPTVPFTGSQVTRAYVLTKWMTTIGIGGAFPYFFNGGLFNPMPGGKIPLALSNFVDDEIAGFSASYFAAPDGEPTLEFSADERSWTHEHLWQNLRLPYYGLLSRGEPEGLLGLFRFFRRLFPLNRLRAQRYFGAAGQFSVEMTLSSGLQTPAIYGADRSELRPGEAANRQGGSLQISPGLELATLMFEYCRHTSDDGDVRDAALELAVDLIDYVESRYRRADGTIEVNPLNSIETYFDTVDPLPVIAGLHRLLDDLAEFGSALDSHRAERVEKFRAAVPNIPVATTPDGTVLQPARYFNDDRKNVEVPEFYAVYPFDVIERSGADPRLSWEHACGVADGFRPRVLGEYFYNACFSGWQHYGVVAARLGLGEQAAEVVAYNSALQNPSYAFPAMWGPVYDAVPDTDHGANIVNTLQEMVLPSGDPDRLLAGWPAEWGVEYKLHDRRGRVVSGSHTVS